MKPVSAVVWQQAASPERSSSSCSPGMPWHGLERRTCNRVSLEFRYVVMLHVGLSRSDAALITIPIPLVSRCQFLAYPGVDGIINNSRCDFLQGVSPMSKVVEQYQEACQYLA